MKKVGLCMIVKDEEKVIARCLDSVKPLIDYVCIFDTGSTDNTVSIINQWLKANNIEGEVHHEKWIDFATNRSNALSCLRNNTNIDYTLTIDADEVLLYDDIDIPKIKQNLNKDLYNVVCKFGAIEYLRTSIFKNSLPFYYRGVLHEFLDCKEPIVTRETIKGIYNKPIQDSARNQDVQKYQRDTEVLEKAIEEETDKGLQTRYKFYLAQSYKDSLQNGKAIYWYEERAKDGGWEQEVYWSLYQIGRLKELSSYPEDDIVQSYMRAYEKCTSRIEALHNAVKFCRTHGRDNQAYIIGKHTKLLPVNKQGLFVETWMWDYGIDDEFSIACYWTGHYKEGLALCKKLLKKIPEDQRERVKQNIMFFEQKLRN